jgi:uncharacterized protein (TIGR03435 family)
MRAASMLAGISVLLVGQSSAQNATPALSFEVASVRLYSQQQSGPTGTSGGPGTRDPERYTGRGMPLRIYLCVAFATPACQEQMSGPGWIDAEKYDIVAKVPPGTSKEQFQKMMQNLLAERFRLAIRHETKTLQVFNLVIARNGPKLRESTTADAPAAGPPAKVEHDADGFPLLPPGRRGFIASFGPGRLSHWTARQQTMTEFARSLTQPNAAGRQVIDKTGLTGKYDFTLMYEMRFPGAPAADDAPALILEDALERQLGLKLVEAKAPFDFVIIDRGDKVPAEN